MCVGVCKFPFLVAVIWQSFAFTLRALWCVVFLLMDVAVVLLYGIIMLFVHTPTCRADDGADPLVILLHGSSADSRQFITVLRRFRSMKLETVALNIPHGEDTTIDHCALVVCDFIGRHVPPQRQRKIILVGVSMGGLVAARAAYNYLPPGTVSGIVTIGSPWKGAPLLCYFPISRILATARHREMTPGSDLLREITCQFQTRTDIPVWTIGSYADIEVPEEYSYPASRAKHHRHITLAAPGHIALTLDRRVWNSVEAFISKV